MALALERRRYGSSWPMVVTGYVRLLSPSGPVLSGSSVPRGCDCILQTSILLLSVKRRPATVSAPGACASARGTRLRLRAVDAVDVDDLTPDEEAARPCEGECGPQRGTGESRERSQTRDCAPPPHQLDQARTSEAGPARPGRGCQRAKSDGRSQGQPGTSARSVSLKTRPGLKPLRSVALQPCKFHAEPRHLPMADLGHE